MRRIFLCLPLAAALILGCPGETTTTGDSTTDTTDTDTTDTGGEDAGPTGTDDDATTSTTGDDDATTTTDDTTDTGDVPDPVEPTCAEYCQVIMESCTGDNAQYASEAECTTVCKDIAQWDVGELEDTDVNTVGCRLYHAGVAATEEPEVHCWHAGPTGGDFCGTWCDNYCHLSELICTGPEAETHPTAEQCQEACLDFRSDGEINDTGGNSVQCRLYHLSVAGTNPPSSAELHCPHAGIDGDGTCVDEPKPDPNCEDYCQLIQVACTGDNAQYADEAACIAYCKVAGQLPIGTADDIKGNTLGCRQYHAGVAVQQQPEIHCDHAGPSGGDVCGSWCDNYCHLSGVNCSGDDAIFADDAECAAACGDYAADGLTGNVDGDTVQCRIYHLGVAGSDKDNGTPAIHCPHGGVDGGEVCVDEEPPPDPTCEAYCAAVTANCTDGNAQYGSETQCNNYCETWGKLPLGEGTDTSGNTVGCRIYHAGVAGGGEAEAAIHCAHAGPSGGDVCGTYCENYCHLSATNCTEDNALYEDDDGCATACADFAAGPDPLATDGDSVQCRIYHLGVAGSDPPDSAGTHCPHGAIDGGDVCVGPVAETCEPVGALSCGDTINGASNETGTQLMSSYQCQVFESDDYGPGLEVAYTFTTETDQLVTVSDTSSAMDVIVLKDEGFGCVSTGTSCLDSGTTSASFAAKAGVEYFIVLDAYDGDTDTFDITVDCCAPTCEGKTCGDDGCGGTCGTCAETELCTDAGVCEAIPEPEADTCDAANAVGALPFSAEATTEYNSDNYGYSTGACPGEEGGWGDSAPDQAWSFTPDEGGLYSVALESNFDSNLYVVTDCADVDGSCVAGFEEVGPNESLTTYLSAGTTYYIIVDGWGFDEGGAYTLNVDLVTPGATPQCQYYCDLIQAACTGANAQYDSVDSCVSYCTTYGALPLGANEDVDGNTVGCRTYHAGVAATVAPDVHCAHAGPSGGDLCGTWCENYCHLSAQNCTGDNELFADDGACAAACDEYATTGLPGDTGGATVQCKIYHLGVAGNADAGGGDVHCSHGGVDGDEVCVAATGGNGDSCDSPFIIGALPYSKTADTTSASSEVQSECKKLFNGSASNEHVYKLTAAEDGDYVFTLVAEHDSLLYVVTDCSGAGTTCLAADDEFGKNLTETVTVTLKADEEVFVVVDGYSAAENQAGEYTLTVEVLPPFGVTCEYYCASITSTCTGDNAQYADEQACLDYCKVAGAFPEGTIDDVDGNSLGCRVYHAGVAGQVSPEVHCPHAGPSGADTCGSWCDNYCHLAQQNCTGGNELYANEAECLSACDTFDTGGEPGDTSGGTAQCKIYHLGVAGSDGDTSAAIHCPHGGADGGGICVAAPGDSCSNAIAIESVPFNTVGDTGSGTPQVSVGCAEASAKGAGSSDLVYSFAPPAEGEYVITLNADHDSLLYVTTDCSGDEESCVATDDVLGGGKTETLTLTLSADTTYYIVVDGWADFMDVSGAFTLSVTAVGGAELTCEYYCASIMAACTGDDAQYADADACNSYCNKYGAFPEGTLDDVDGNTLGCRIYHAGVAGTVAPDVHCAHAGPSGGDICGTWCENYCDLAEKNCTGGDALFADNGSCMSTCNGYSDDGAPGDTGGDTVQCRIYHLGVAGNGDAGGATTHCPHGDADGGGVCVDDTTPTLDVSGWTVIQNGGEKTFEFPAGTVVKEGDYIVIGRNASQEDFTLYWGVNFSGGVHYFDANNQFPIVNGDESFDLLDATDTLVDGPSANLKSGFKLQRKQPVGAASDAGSWDQQSAATGVGPAPNPGTGQTPGVDNGLYLSELSDANGSGNFIYEFVEIYVSGLNGDVPIVEPEPGPVEVEVKNFAFSPADITVSVGTTVTWTFLDGSSHTVTSTDNKTSNQTTNDPLDSPFLKSSDAPDNTYSYTFTEAGLFTYRCIPHASMKGSVNVE